MIKNSSFYIFQIDKIRLVDYNDGEFRRGGVWMELTKSEMEIMDVVDAEETIDMFMAQYVKKIPSIIGVLE